MYAQKIYRNAENGKSSLKVLVHRLTQPENQHKNITLNSTYSTGEGDTLISKHLPEKEESVEMLPGTETLAGIIFAISGYLANASAGGCHFGILLLTPPPMGTPC